MPDVECNGSPYYYIDFAADGGGAYWNPTTHGIYAFDYLLNPYPLTDATMGGEDITQNLTNYDCLHCSYSYAAWTERGYVILRNNANQDRYLYMIDGSFSGQYLNSRVKLDPNSHMAKAEHYATNGSSASYIYCAEGGKLYGDETERGAEAKTYAVKEEDANKCLADVVCESHTARGCQEAEKQSIRIFFRGRSLRTFIRNGLWRFCQGTLGGFNGLRVYVE